MNKKNFTRQEKIVYYASNIARAKSYLAYAQKRLDYLVSEDYQDFSETVSKQIEKSKKGSR